VDREILLESIERVRRRLAAREAWRWGGRVALVWSGALMLLVLARAIVPISLPYGVLALAGLLAGLVAAAAVRLVSVPSPLLAAQILDHRFGCADRMATAVEILTGRHRATALTGAAVRDAAARAQEIDLGRLPARPDRTAGAAAALAVLAVLAAGALKGLTLPGTPARDVARTIRQEGQRLERAGQAMEEQARIERARISRRLAPDLRRLGEALQRERMERGDALARLESFGRQVETERQQVRSRREQMAGLRPQAGPMPSSDLFRQRAALDRAARHIREIADRLAESRSPEEREALMRQLAALASSGEGQNMPAGVRQQVESARQQAAAGDAARARRTLQQSAADLDDLRAMLADEEGLQQAQWDLHRSAEQIARGGSEIPVDTEQLPRASARPGKASPGERPPTEEPGSEQTEAPAGPHQGTLPGHGTIAGKLGPRTERLDAEREQTRLEGLQGEGRTTTSELLGPGRAARVRTPAGPEAASARADADRYMARMRIPPEYRDIVRRYFEALAAAR
jgi:hypothetical protein